MYIVNNSNNKIYVDGHEIEPKDRYDVYETIFDTHNIHSDFGSAEVVTEYCERHIKTFGNMVVNNDDDVLYVNEQIFK